MRERDEHVGGAGGGQKRPALVVETHERLATRAVIDGDGLPAQLGADAGGERLRHRLLGREPRGEVARRELVGEGIRPLLLGEHPLQEAVALSLEHAPDPRDLDDVAAEAEQDAAGGKVEGHGEVASSG